MRVEVEGKDGVCVQVCKHALEQSMMRAAERVQI